MPPILTQVARRSDALPLVATSTPTHNLIVTSKHQSDAKQLMMSMTTSNPNKMAIASENMVFYYMQRESLCFLTLCEEKYPKRLAFLYLDEIADLILQEMTNEYGANWRLTVDQAARPFQFIHYDPVIQRKQREYRDQSTAGSSGAGTGGGGGSGSSSSTQHRSQLNEDLNEIHTIMRKNIDEILNRGEKLDQVQSISQELKNKSSNFKWGTKRLTLQARIQQYGPTVVIVLIIVIVLYVKIFHIGF